MIILERCKSCEGTGFKNPGACWFCSGTGYFYVGTGTEQTMMSTPPMERAMVPPPPPPPSVWEQLMQDD